MFGFISTRWPQAFFAVSCLQLVACLVIEGYAFTQFHLHTDVDDLCSSSDCPADQKEVRSQSRTVTTFLALFIFGFLYEVVLVWDALRLKNTIQVIIICVANLALLVFTALQPDQIREAIIVIDADRRLKDPDLWSDLRPFLIVLPIIVGVCTMAMAAVAWKLYQQFAWDILKHIGADYRMKKRFFHYQIYIALLKVDFFFFLAFTVQFLVIVNDETVELALTIAAIPLCVITLATAAYLTRRESRPGVTVTIVLYLAALAYFFFKLVRIYQPGFSHAYAPVRRSLTAFAVLTIILLILTIANALVCMKNFGRGLKHHLLESRGSGDGEKPDMHSIDMGSINPQLPSRMTIE